MSQKPKPHLDDPHEAINAQRRLTALQLATGFTKKLNAQPNAEHTTAMAHAFYLFLSEGVPSYDETLADLRKEVKRLRTTNNQLEHTIKLASRAREELEKRLAKVTLESQRATSELGAARKNYEELQKEFNKVSEELHEAKFEIREIHT